MQNELIGLDVSSEFARAKTQLDQVGRLQSRLMDDVQGFALFMLNREGRVTNWNPGAMHLTGYMSKDIIGQHLSYLYDKRELQMHSMPQFCLSVAIKQGFYENKCWWTRRDVPHFLAQVIIMHIANNGGCFAVMAWDISKNIRATAELDGSHMRDSPLNE